MAQRRYLHPQTDIVLVSEWTLDPQKAETNLRKPGLASEDDAHGRRCDG